MRASLLIYKRPPYFNTTWSSSSKNSNRPVSTGKSSANVYTSAGKDIRLSCLPNTFNTARNEPILFFFQAEDGIRDVAVTGVQTCALPISIYRTCNYLCTGKQKPAGKSRRFKR